MLRHTVDLGDLRAVDRAVEVREIVPKFRAPKRVVFRRDGDMSALMEVVRTTKYVEVLAAVGAGKSTKLPSLLAKTTGSLVIHTIPFAVAARYLSEYLATTDNGDRIVYMDDLTSDMPQHGVVIMTTGFFHARMAHDKFHGITNAVLYLDEIHESDAYTAVLRDVAPAMRMFRTVVKATATIDPGAAERPILPGERVEMTYPRRAVSTWKSDDVGMPWSVSNIEANTLIAIDRADVRDRLAIEYQNAGYDVRICLADVSYDYFRETVRRLSDPDGGVVILMVDYAYRSSFTLPGLSNIIDSCEVGIAAVDEGRPVTVYRAAYDFEVQQFLGRGARLPGDKAVLWRSNEPSAKFMCDLESLERDAANLLYRLLGFRPPPVLAGYAYYKGDVPMDISAAMRGKHPLSLCPPESLEPWVNGRAAVEKQNVVAPYKYEFGERGRKYASCHTVADVGEKSVSPPPPVPEQYRSTSVDREALDDYASERARSPSVSSAIYTLDSDEVPDNVSLYDPNSEHYVLQKPKRVAKRVLEKRRLEAESLRDAPVVSSVDVGVVTQPGAVVASESTVVAPLSAGSVVDKRVHNMTGIVSELQSITAAVDKSTVVPDDMNGKYIYYHGMDNAPDKSGYFLKGVDSVFGFCDGKDAQRLAKVLPESEKLWAMRKLVNACNESTAIAMGIQRVIKQIMLYPIGDWDHILDREALIDVVRWMSEASTNARSRVALCHTVMPYFLRYSLDVIPAALGLEQQVMVQVTKKFEEAAVKKDPDKMVEYIRNLNGRLVNVGGADAHDRIRSQLK